MVFYSRYAIHEVVFALSLVLFFYFWLRARNGDWSKSVVVGLGLSLGSMMSLKKTFFIFIGCLLIADSIHFRLYLGRAKEFLFVVGIAFLFAAVLFTGGFQDSSGIRNFFEAFTFWKNTGDTGNGHAKPAYYWIQIMAQYEWPMVLGLIASPFVLFLKKAPEVRLLVVMTFGHFLAYTIIPYKTPWCMISFYWGFAIYLGYLIAGSHWKWTKHWVLKMAIVFGVLFSINESYRVAYRDVDSNDHPYIYGQTFRSFMGPLNKIVAKGKTNPDWRKVTRIQVVSEFTWPLPWVLGEFGSVGYYSISNAPARLDGDYLLIDSRLLPRLNDRIAEGYSREQVESRQWASPMTFLTAPAQQ